MKPHLRATKCHLSYGITQCYLPPDTSEHTLPVRYLPTQQGWKAELTQVTGFTADMNNKTHTFIYIF